MSEVAPKTLVGRLRAEFLTRLEQVVPRGSRVALLDFPNHANGGDTAIWIGELAALSALDCELAHVSGYGSYSAGVLRRRLGADGIVLLHGGGNFGDLWPTFQAHREQVFAEHHRHRVVQLPQSVHFGSLASVERTRAAIEGHSDAYLLVRDHESRRFCEEHLAGVRVSLSPDAAFAIGSLVAPVPALDLILFARTDQERRTAWPDTLPDRARMADWPQPTRRLEATKQLSRALGFPLKYGGEPYRALEAPVRRLYAGLARRRLTAGLDVLGSGKVVVTDRLHGHILSLLLDRPHVLLDNAYGKNRRFLECWTAESPRVTWADSWSEGISAALEVVGQDGAGGSGPEAS